MSVPLGVVAKTYYEDGERKTDILIDDISMGGVSGGRMKLSYAIYKFSTGLKPHIKSMMADIYFNNTGKRSMGSIGVMEGDQQGENVIMHYEHQNLLPVKKISKDGRYFAVNENLNFDYSTPYSGIYLHFATEYLAANFDLKAKGIIKFVWEA